MKMLALYALIYADKDFVQLACLAGIKTGHVHLYGVSGNTVCDYRCRANQSFPKVDRRSTVHRCLMVLASRNKLCL